MSKIVTFQIYRYHLLPISNDRQTALFTEEKPSVEDIKKNKNLYLSEVLEKINYYNDNRYPLKVEHHENNFYFIKLAQKKSATIVQNFKDFEIENEPFVYIIINNDDKVQKIAISDNKNAFSSPNVVKNILKDLLISGLKQYSLNIEIEELFNSENFWKFVNQHKYALQQIDFKFIKPNLANISKSLPEDFRRFAENVNSHESHITIKAPQNGILENIDKQNPNIEGLVNYTSEGAGDIRLKIDGFSKKYSTKQNPVLVKITSLSLEGPAEQIIKTYQELISE